MRLLVLGGTGYLSALVAREALARGHSVTCVTRGRGGRLPDGVDALVWDRLVPAPDDVRAALADLAPETVIDVVTTPLAVRNALDALASSAPGAHWTYVSSVSVYADHSAPTGTATPRHAPLPDALAPPATAAEYGGMKAASEDAVRERPGAEPAGTLVVRPGLLGGPGDETGRLAYWPAHALAAATDGDPRLLVPGDPEARAQVLDARDLATFLVDSAEARRTGTLDAVGTPTAWADVVAALEHAVGTRLDARRRSDSELLAADVRPWAGPRSLPMWLGGDADLAGMQRWPGEEAIAAGLAARPLAATLADVAAWLRAAPGAAVTGLTRAEELAVLDAGTG